MVTIGAETSISPKKILYLTDFSNASKAALPFATALADNYGSTLIAFHVLIPAHDCTDSELRTALVEADEEIAQAEIQHVDSQMAGTAHQTLIDRGSKVWPSVERAINSLLNNSNSIIPKATGARGISLFVGFLLKRDPSFCSE